ncbi:hypothetical protein OHA40_11010 [Nocardia sp. NBC_00508]|uniref:hypothetical protein n=1 Tax=Nocardia sp. NBC_00508 TaxID=2975992 RepID=UPI002E820543|nr:hypothetical protein [Nocardia sp. NBC_00508]WUD68587.1 hypothetical protein OHA40_11010 [Nocardia sp. NBC_00508]
MTVSWQGKAIDAILDEGSYGLQYWIRFMPLYEAAFGNNGGRGDLGKLLAMYDEQRGTRVEKLEQAGEALKAALAEVDTQWDAQRSYTGRLPGLWQGSAATAALDLLTEQSLLADEDRVHARDAWKTIEPMANSLRESVGGKADIVLGLLEDSGKDSRVVKIGGKSPEDVKVIVDVHKAREWISGNQVRDLGRIFPALDVPGYSTKLQLDTPLGEKIRDTVNDWLKDPFKRDFDAKLTRYIDACKQTDDHFKQQYQNLATALAAVSDRAYPRPEGPTQPSQDKPENQNQPNPSAPPGPPGTPSPSTVPAGTTPSTVPASTTPTTPSTPAPLAPKMPSIDGLAAINQVAREFSPLATGLTQTISQGITALSGTIKSGIDDAIERLKASIDPKNAEKDGEDRPKAEFDIAGKHVKFEMGPDGQLKLMLSDATGKQEEFSVELNEHGIPIISMTEPRDENAQPPASEDPAPDAPEKKMPADATPAPGDNTGQPGLPTGTPPAAPREEDGEHRPKPMSEHRDSEPDAPLDSGAELAEAGPLGAELAEAGPL